MVFDDVDDDEGDPFSKPDIDAIAILWRPRCRVEEVDCMPPVSK